MPTPVGRIGGFTTLGTRGSEFTINWETASQIFRSLSIEKDSLVANRLGLYSFLPIGRDGKAKLHELRGPKHVLQGSKNCATWNPKGTQYILPQNIDSMGLEFNGEMCSDGLFAEYYRKMLAEHTNQINLLESAEFRQLYALLLENIYTAINNSTVDLVAYSRHPLIETANTNTSYDTSEETAQDWANFYDQMFATDQEGKTMKGHLTLIDEEKTAGTGHFNLSFADGDWDDSTGVYTGSDITASLDLVMRTATRRFQPMVRRTMAGQPSAIFAVTRSVFDAYYDHLVANYGGITEGYQLRINGELVPGVLTYRGIPVYAHDDWSDMDYQLNIKQHRIVLTAAGNLGVAHSLQSLDEKGMEGMIIQQSPELKAKGRIDMLMKSRLNAFISDTDLMVNMSLVE